MADGRLVTMPRRATARRLVLNEIVQRFDVGRRYSERDVNDILRPLHDDVAALRRYLVDGDFLDRADGLYWRSGGSVEL